MVNCKLLMNGLIRAGFTLSRALFRKNVGPFNGDGRLYFPRKKLSLPITVCVSAISSPQKLATFFAHHCHFHSEVTHFSGLHKNYAPFVGAPARPNMLNMPKSAAWHIFAHKSVISKSIRQHSVGQNKHFNGTQRHTIHSLSRAYRLISSKKQQLNRNGIYLFIYK